MPFEFSLYVVTYTTFHRTHITLLYIYRYLHNRMELNLKAERERSPTVRRHIIIYYIGVQNVYDKSNLAKLNTSVRSYSK